MSKQQAPDSPVPIEERRMSWADIVEEELAEGYAESSGSAAKRAGTQDAQLEENSLDDVESRSHFSDSSSDGELEKDENKDPFEDFDSSVSHNENVIEQTNELTTTEPELPFKSTITLPHAFHNGAILPIIGKEVYADKEGDLHRGDLQVLTSGRLRLKKSKSSSDINYRHTYGMPSLFKAEANEGAATERHRIGRDLARQERDKANGSLEHARETLARVRSERNKARHDLKRTRDERKRAFGVASGLKGQLKETEGELATRRVEAESWKKAFESQKPFALAEHERLRRKEQGMEDSVEVGTQTEFETPGLSGVETMFVSAKTEPETLCCAKNQTADFGMQTESLIDMPLALPSEIRSKLAEHIVRWLDFLQNQTSGSNEIDFVPSADRVEKLLSDHRTSFASLVSALQQYVPTISTAALAQQIETCLGSSGTEVPISISCAVRNFSSIERAVDMLLKGSKHLESEIERLQFETEHLQTSKLEMKHSVHGLVQRYRDLQTTNKDLQRQLDEQLERSTIPTPERLGQLDQFMEHAREINAECDLLRGAIAEHRREAQGLQEANNLLRDQARQYDAKLAASEDKRKKLDAEKAKLKAKHVRIRQWIQETSAAAATSHALPSPCTPLPFHSPWARQSITTEAWERKRLAELREPTMTSVVRSREAGPRSDSMKGVFRVDLKLEWQGLENLVRLLLYVLLPALLLFRLIQ